jgi:hypothetical protein
VILVIPFQAKLVEFVVKPVDALEQVPHDFLHRLVTSNLLLLGE